jgi:hypothetical protein
VWPQGGGDGAQSPRSRRRGERGWRLEQARGVCDSIEVAGREMAHHSGVPTTVGGRAEEVTGEGSMRRLSTWLEMPVR